MIFKTFYKYPDYPLMAGFGLITTVTLILWTSWLYYTKRRHARRVLSLRERYPGWAVVTGASSGIGEQYARRLASLGFNVVLVARRVEVLTELAEELKQLHSVNTKVFGFDFCKSFENVEALRGEFKDLDIGFVVHMAGNSDLAQHFTDESLERNIELLRLNCEGTLVVLQEFCSILATQNHRSAIITAGALSAYVPCPGLAASSGNKAYVQNITMAVAWEFKEKIDIMCAHPIMVASSIVSNAKGLKVIIPASVFVDNTLGDLGFKPESNGHWLHDLAVRWILVRLSYNTTCDVWWGNVYRFSKILQRPIDLRSLEEKFPSMSR